MRVLWRRGLVGRSGRRSVVVGVVAAITVMCSVTTACRPAVVGRRCATTELGRDATHVLVCRGGRWQRLMTLQAAAEALASASTQPATPPNSVPPTPGPSPQPAVVAPRGSQLAAGADFTCAIVANGRVRCWGNNDRGQLGDGTNVSRHTPADVTGLTNAVALSAEGDHACAIVQPPSAAPSLWCWGGNWDGVLGDGSTTDRRTPVLSLGGLAVTKVSVGLNHSCAIDSEGIVQCWGSNGSGELAAPVSVSRSLAPVPVIGPPPGATLLVATSVAAGQQSCATYSDGSGWCWGFNVYGAVGDNSERNLYDSSYPNRRSPVPVWGLRDADGIDANGNAACARFLASSPAEQVLLKCWGSLGVGDRGRLGEQYTSKAFTLRDTRGVQKAAVGGGFACGLLVGGRLECWGNGPKGLAGADLAAAGPNWDSPRPVPTAATVVDVTAGDYHACALLVTGVVQCWGDNDSGQLGVPASGLVRTPVAVQGLR